MNLFFLNIPDNYINRNRQKHPMLRNFAGLKRGIVHLLITFLCLFLPVSLYSQDDEGDEESYASSYSHDLGIEIQSVLSEKVNASPNDEKGKLSQIKSLLNLDYSGRIDLFGDFSLLLNGQIDGMSGATTHSPFSQYNRLGTSTADLGIEYSGLGRMQLRGFFDFFHSSQMIKYPTDHNTLTPENNARLLAKHYEGFDFYWHLPIERFSFDADLLYTNLTFDYSLQDEEVTQQNESDLWINSLVHYIFKPIKRRNFISLKAGALMKHDLNTFGGYNLAEGIGGVESELKLYKRKILIRAALLGRFLISSMAEEKGYADGFGLLPRFRVLIVPKKRLYLKTDLAYELAPAGQSWMIKQKYQLTFVQAWRKTLGRLEAGTWASLGGLYPRICLFSNGAIPLGSKVKILPLVKMYFQAQSSGKWNKVDSLTSGFDTTQITKFTEDGIIYMIDKWGNKFAYTQSFDQYSFYRTDLELVGRYQLASERNRLLENLAFHLGLKYQIYKSYRDQEVFITPNVNNLRLSFGITSYL